MYGLNPVVPELIRRPGAARVIAVWLLGLAVPATAAPPSIDSAIEQLADKALVECIRAAAVDNDWKALDDVTALRCHQADIESLTGIEQFTALESLSLFRNRIASAELSRLPDLQSLNLAGNSLSTITLSDLPSLQTLYLFDNKLESLELNSFPRLKKLKANQNGMTQFTYSDLPLLSHIYLYDNVMETIDIDALPAMEYMDVRQNPMPDELYEEMDAMPGVTILHDGNAEDWQ